ncbi:hypothetical protein [Cellulomonas sp. PhB143]|uniref:hypothetical protein n=1 Tax=Cellulomonas sp. PhB143 TaxID=2485186 RepID=UPI000F46483B|nr:hypothetical protein [Cellulomonas sp. PhB143]ROS76585.1 hypothetical protein EDF32_1404 [Cellulomonas sp. PhB143]
MSQSAGPSIVWPVLVVVALATMLVSLAFDSRRRVDEGSGTPGRSRARVVGLVSGAVGILALTAWVLTK